MHRILLYISLLIFTGCSGPDYNFKFMELDTGTGSSLRAICAVDKNIVWASGSQGQIVLSVNGGDHWKVRSVPGCEDTEFRSLHAWDALRALVFDVSPLGRAFLTKDGGLNWEEVYRSPVEGAFFNSLKFADELHGIAISDPIDKQVFILKTEDGGSSWKRLENTPQVVPGEINFAASNTCIEYLPSGNIYIVTGGSRSRILHSRDHGDSWEFIETPVISGESAGLFSVNFGSTKTGVAVGGDFNEPAREGVRAIFTEDGGANWKQAESMPAAYRSCVVPMNENLLFAIGKTGCDYSSNGGKNWTFISSEGYYAASTVKGTNTIYLSGSEGRIAKVMMLTRQEPVFAHHDNEKDDDYP